MIALTLTASAVDASPDPATDCVILTLGRYPDVRLTTGAARKLACQLGWAAVEAEIDAPIQYVPVLGERDMAAAVDADGSIRVTVSE